MRAFACLLFVFLTTPLLAAQTSLPTTIKDDFSTYAEGSSAENVWYTGAGAWAVVGKTFTCADGSRFIATPIKAPYARRMIVEATVRTHKAVGKLWKLAGLVIHFNEDNYWHLALCETPDTTAKNHYSELNEKYKGTWLANTLEGTKLTPTFDIGRDFAWEYEHSYHLRMEVTKDGISGIISELDGTVRVSLGYRFDNPAVMTGKPSLFGDGMNASFSDYHAEITELAPAPPKPVFPPYTSKPAGTIHGKKTGYFHVEKIGDRWWTIDPAGNSFYIVGTDHVNYNVHFAESLGYAPYNRSVVAKFGTEEKWAVSSIARLKSWGFNSLGAGCGVSTRHRGLAHTDFLSLGAGFTAISDIAERTTWTGFPDVFHPRFSKWCEQEALRICGPSRDDPWLIGYFIDNELEWFGKNYSQTGLVDETFKKHGDHPAKKALVAFLQKRYSSIDAFNKAWGANITDWDAMAQSTTPITSSTVVGKKDSADFVLLIADRYFAITSGAIRKADPNHMVLGCRFAGFAPPGLYGVAGKYCDIVSENFYGRVDRERGISTDMPDYMRKCYAEAKRPMMLTEWSFPALDAGLPCKGGAGQRVPTQKDKALCFDIYQRTLFGLPFMVGSDYFMWADEPAEGISKTFPEDSNYGMVDVNDNVWVELTNTIARINPLAQQLHGGQTAEISAEIITKSGSLTVARLRNQGRVGASFTVRICANGQQMDKAVTLAASASKDLPVAVKGSAYVSVKIDPDRKLAEANLGDNFADQIVIDPKLKRPLVAVANPTDIALTNVGASVALGKLGAKWSITSAGVESQVDDLPNGPEMALLVDEIPARGVRVYSLTPSTSALSQRSDNDIQLELSSGAFKLDRDAASGNILSRVSLDGLQLGLFRALVHQTGAGISGWTNSDSTDKATAWIGPARTVLLTTTVGGVSPGTFRVTTRLNHFSGEPWFSARFVRIESTDAAPWKFVSYFLQPLSAIGGSSADDQPINIDSLHEWYDAKEGAVYGAIVEGEKINASFWKDNPTGESEHPDIYRDLNVDMKMGTIVNADADDPEIIVFGERTTTDKSGGPVVERIKALKRVKTVIVP